MMTDGPYEDALAVLIDIAELSVHRTGGGWETLELEGGGITCNLKLLEGPLDFLGDGQLEAGKYTQMRVTVAGGALYFENESPVADPCVPTADVVEPAGLKGTLSVPSGVVHLNRPFTVPDGGEVTIVLDFDGDASIRKVGNPNGCNGNAPGCDEESAGTFRLSPVIAVVSVDEIAGDGGELKDEDEEEELDKELEKEETEKEDEPGEEEPADEA